MKQYKAAFSFAKQIPVYGGAERPLNKLYEPNDYFGSDGFGDFNFTERITAKVRAKNASVALVDLVQQYPGTYRLVRSALSALTYQLFYKEISKCADPL